MEYNYNYNMY